MKNYIAYLLFLLPFLFSCKKEEVNKFPEIYPSAYMPLERHYYTPYVRMFTMNGELKNESVIQEYITRRQLAGKFIFREVVPDLNAPVNIGIKSKDKVGIQYYNSQNQALHGPYKLNEHGVNRDFKGTRVSTQFLAGDNYLLRLRRDISLYKWEYEVIPDSDGIDTWEYKCIPEIHAYKTDTNLLAMPFVTCQSSRVYSTILNFPNRFDSSVCKTLSATDTLLIQESSLIFKRQY